MYKPDQEQNPYFNPKPEVQNQPEMNFNIQTPPHPTAANQVHQNPAYPQNQENFVNLNLNYPQNINQDQAQIQAQNQVLNYNPADPNYYINQNFTPPIPAPEQTVKPNMLNQFNTKIQGFSQNKIIEKLKKNWWLVVGGLILLTFITATGLYLFNSLSGPKTNYLGVGGKITSDARVPSGSLGNWTITIENRENVTMDKVRLLLNFDRTFSFSRSLYQQPEAVAENQPYGSIYSIGQLKPLGTAGSTALIKFEGTLTGDLDTEALMSGIVEYQPVGSSKKLQVELEKNITKIGSPELTLDLQAPTQIKNGSETDIYVDFRNSSDKTLSNLRIKMNYPSSPGFKYISSELQLTKSSDIKRQPDEGDNVWLVPELPRFTPQQLKIHGQFVGVPGEIKKLEVEIGIQNSQTGEYQTLAKKNMSVTITGDTLQVSSKLSGKDNAKFFSPGETITLEVNYKNNSNRNLEDMKVLGWIEDPAELLDYKTIAFTGGDKGNYNNGKLEWRQQTAPQLRIVPPNASGKLSFTIKVKEGKDFLNGKNQSEFTLRPRAIINALATEDVSVVGSEYRALGILKFDSKTERQARIPANKNDPNASQIATNEGLKPGVPVTYIVTWNLYTTQNNVNNVKVRTRSSLPANMWDQTTISPITEANNISYDKNTGEIIWNPGNLPGYTGITNPVRTISFKITFTPSEAQINSGGVELYEGITVSGTDDFTSQVFQLNNPGVTVN